MEDFSAELSQASRERSDVGDDFHDAYQGLDQRLTGVEPAKVVKSILA